MGFVPGFATYLTLVKSAGDCIFPWAQFQNMMLPDCGGLGSDRNHTVLVID
jgi:hypothetical protein